MSDYLHGHHASVLRSHRSRTAANSAAYLLPYLRVRDLVEPEWPEGHEQDWGGWSALRGRLIPGTLVVVADKP